MSPRPASTTPRVSLAHSPGVRLLVGALFSAIGPMSDLRATAQESEARSPAKRPTAIATDVGGASGLRAVAGGTASDWARRLGDAAPETRRMAAANLAQFGPAAVSELLAAVRHGDADVRFWALRGLRRPDSPSKAGFSPESEDSVVKAATEALRDGSPAVRLAAASVLASFNRIESAVPVLVAELSATQGGARILAISELARLRQLKPSHLDAATLTAIRRAKDEDDQNEYVVRIAKRILGESSE